MWDCPKRMASTISCSETSVAPASTITTSVSVPTTTRSNLLDSSWEVVGLMMKP